MGYTIRPFSNSVREREWIVQFEHRVFGGSPDHWGSEIFEVMRRPRTYMLYATEGTTMLGFVLYWCTTFCSTVHIGKLAVDTRFRRKGIGTNLLEAVRKACRDSRVESMTLHVDTSNQAAINLYAKLGFLSEGKVCDYYSKGRHAYKMRAPVV